MMATLSEYNKYYHEDSVVLLPDVIKSSMVAYWNLDEVSGADRVDSVAGVALADLVTVGDYSDPVFGRVADFSGVASSALQIDPANCRWIPYNSIFSITGWFYMDTQTDHHCIMSRADNGVSSNSGVDWQLLWNNSTGKLDMGAMVGSTLYPVAWATAINTGQWYFYYAYYDPINAEVGLSLDLEPIQTAAVTGNMNTGGDRLKIGRRSFTAGAWDAYLDGKATRVGMYTRLLSARERSYIWNNNKGRKYAEFV